VIHPDLKLPRDEIAEFCRRHHIKTLSLFGSATRGDFRPDSDVDFLTEFDPEVSIGLAEYLDMEEKLAGIVGRPVDLIERKTIEQSRNYIRSKHILSNLEPVYVAR
jgi:uncharacterized protein